MPVVVCRRRLSVKTEDKGKTNDKGKTIGKGKGNTKDKGKTNDKGKAKDKGKTKKTGKGMGTTIASIISSTLSPGHKKWRRLVPRSGNK